MRATTSGISVADSDGKRRDRTTRPVLRCATSCARARRPSPDRAEHVVDDRQQVRAGLRERDRARAAVEQPHAERFLQLADLRRQRGLRGVQRVARAA